MGFQGEDIFPFLEKCLAGLSSDVSVMTEMFKCLSSWLRFGGQFTIRIAESPLLEAAFAAMVSGNADLVDASRDAIIAAVKLANGPNQQFHPKLKAALFPRILKLSPHYQKLLAAGDIDEAKDVALLFGYLADSFAYPIICEVLGYNPGRRARIGDKNPQVTIIMQLMAQLSATRIPEIFTIPCYFWPIVAEEHCVLEGEMPHWPDSEGGKERSPDPYSTVSAAIQPAFLQFVGNMLHVVKCPADQKGMLDPNSELSDFRERMFNNRREDASGVMVDTIHYDAQMANAVAEHIWKICNVANAPWDAIEAGLFVVMSVIRFAEPSSTVAPAVAQAMVKLPAAAHPQLRQTAVRLFGELASWSSKVPGAVAPLFVFLLGNLKIRPMLATALRSIRNMCKDSECRKQMGGQLEQIVEIVKHAAGLGLTRLDVIDMIGSAARVIAALKLTGPGNVTTGTAFLCTPLLQSVQAALASGKEKETVNALENVTALFKHLHFHRSTLCVKDASGNYVVDKDGTRQKIPAHPCWTSGSQVWQAIKACIAKFPASKDVAEEGSRCTKALFRSLDVYAAPLLGEAIQQSMQLYVHHYHPSCLYIAGKLVDIFGDKPEYVASFFQMLQAFTAATFKKLTGLPAMDANPEIVVDYCILLYEVLRGNPQMILGTPLGAQTVQFGIAALSMQTSSEVGSEPNDRVSDFLRCLIGSKRREDSRNWPLEVQQQVDAGLRSVLQSQGQQLVFALMKGLAGGLPPEDRYINNMATILWEVHQLAPQECLVWLRAALARPELSGGRVTPAQKEALCVAFAPKEGKIREDKAVWFTRHLIGPFARLFHPVSATESDGKKR